MKAKKISNSCAKKYFPRHTILLNEGKKKANGSMFLSKILIQSEKKKTVVTVYKLLVQQKY